MTALVTEFTAINDIALDEAYIRACRYVEQQRPVAVVDSRDARRDRFETVALAMFAAKHPEFRKTGCVAALTALTDRQAADEALSLGIATIGSNGDAEIDAIAATLSDKPLGAWRWISATEDANGLYETIVRWLILIVDRMAKSGDDGGSLAEDETRSIDTALTQRTGEDLPFGRYWGNI